jgi:hypothetical protein
MSSFAGQSNSEYRISGPRDCNNDSGSGGGGSGSGSGSGGGGVTNSTLNNLVLKRNVIYGIAGAQNIKENVEPINCFPFERSLKLVDSRCEATNKIHISLL